MVLAVLSVVIPRASWLTLVDRAPQQPVPFSHEHHVGQLGLDCRYCHNGVETSAAAGLPATEVCMTCHSQVWTNAAMLAPVRQSLANNDPIEWKRVHRLPDFVFLNHSIHVNKGIGCETCHGRVDQMPLIHKVNSLTMGWCLDCHRNPEPNLRPPSAVFTMGWQPPPDIDELRKRLVDVLSIHPENMTDCYVCHR
jgi:hypothetical protein